MEEDPGNDGGGIGAPPAVEKGGKLGGGSIVGNMGGGLIPAGMLRGGNLIEEKSMLGGDDALLVVPETAAFVVSPLADLGLLMRYGCCSFCG